MKTVKVTANPKTGLVFTQAIDATGKAKLDKNGKEYGFIRIESRTANLGFAYSKGAKVRSMLISMTKEAYTANAELYSNGSVHTGQIIRKDSLIPFFEGQKPLETGGDNSKVITSGGAPVYRNESFTENVNAQDEKLELYDTIAKEVVAAAGRTLAQ